jgi:RNA polymerase sigma-70 factor (ECF subfamily)
MQMSEDASRRGFADPAEAGGRVARDAGVFATTHWSVVRNAAAANSVESMAALDRLCRQYWRPLYYFVRRRGYQEEDAQDLTQGFFARFLEKQSIAAADRDRGRFRTFLLTSMEHYLANEWDRAHRQKRGGDRRFLSLEEAASAEAGYQLLPGDAATPDRLYDRRWAQGLLEVVLRRLRAEFDERHGHGRFEVLKEFLFGDRGDVSYAEAAARLQLSESATKSAIHRLRHRYGELFEEEIAQTVARPEDLDDEVRHLLAALEE